MAPFGIRKTLTRGRVRVLIKVHAKPYRKVVGLGGLVSKNWGEFVFRIEVKIGP